jgi:hypothetical protein
MTRDAKLFVMSAAVALTSVGLLVVRELELTESGRWAAVGVVALVLVALAMILWRRD